MTRSIAVSLFAAGSACAAAVLCLALFAMPSVAQAMGDSPADPVAEATASEAEACTGVEHKVTLLREGSRSEAQQGWLTVDCVLLPDTFTQVTVDGRQFDFYQRANLWGADGYHPSQAMEEVSLSAEAISDADLARGWYLGQARLQGTPESWFRVKWAGGEAWVQAAHVADLVEAENLPILERDKMMGQLLPGGSQRQELEPMTNQ